MLLTISLLEPAFLAYWVNPKIREVWKDRKERKEGLGECMILGLLVFFN